MVKPINALKGNELMTLLKWQELPKAGGEKLMKREKRKAIIHSGKI